MVDVNPRMLEHLVRSFDYVSMHGTDLELDGVHSLYYGLSFPT